MGARIADTSIEVIHRIHGTATRRARRLSARAGERRRLHYLDLFDGELKKGGQFPVTRIFDLSRRGRAANRRSSASPHSYSRTDAPQCTALPLGPAADIQIRPQQQGGKSFANRFVAGETVDTALAAVTRLNARGITASLDLLGESVHNDAEARAAGEAYLSMLDRIHKQKADANVSVKLTAMGLDISEDLCVANMQKILQRARDCASFVRIDMESSEYTQRTLDLFEQRLYPAYRENVGIVLQSYLYRTFSDVERAISMKARVRLCKGAYKEPETVAFPDKKDVDANYVRCMHELMLKGTTLASLHTTRRSSGRRSDSPRLTMSRPIVMSSRCSTECDAISRIGWSARATA